MTDTQSTPFVNTPEILYRLRAANGDLLYVGITRDFPSRLKQHYADKPWAYEIRSTEQVHIDGTRSQIEAIEKAVIIAEKPRHNKTHNAEVRRTLTAPGPLGRIDTVTTASFDPTYGQVTFLTDNTPHRARLGTWWWDDDVTVAHPAFGLARPFDTCTRFDTKCLVLQTVGEPRQVWIVDEARTVLELVNK